MDILQAMKERHSVRRYTDKPIEPEKVAEIKKAIDMCEEGLFDRMCAYLQKCAMEQMYNEEDLDYGWPPAYDE